MKNQNVNTIEENLNQVSDRDSLLSIGRSYLTRARAQGVTRQDLKPLLSEAFGADDSTTGGQTTGSQIK